MKTGKNSLQTIKTYSSYNTYVRKEWEIFEANSERRAALVNATKGMPVGRVLDLGCGAGQEMLPFAERGAQCVGVDLMPEVGQVGREMYAKVGFSKNVEFIRASGNEMPFASESFDVLICRGALMFMNNRMAIEEIARILRPGGRFLLMYQAPAYYWWKLRNGLRTKFFKSSIHAARVLFGGYLYQLTDEQPFNRMTAGGEIFQTKSTLQREFSRVGLKIMAEMPDTNDQTPSIVAFKVP